MDYALVVGIIGGAVLVMVFIAVALLCVCKKRKPKSADLDIESEDQSTIFDLETLKNATRDFSNDKKLGEGGFGFVYKGILANGKEIAVKKLSIQSNQGEKEFLNEAELLAKVQHKNLVHIVGYCAEGSERLLVYEYLPNKSLDKFLFDPRQSEQLDWQMRFNIIRGIASGLLYLHEGSPNPIIHRDIKAGNILLDKKMEPKIADFGLARMLVEDQSHVSTAVAGSFGYIAPELLRRGNISLKTDIYSFGILILEILCGKKSTDQKRSDQFLTKLAWESFHHRRQLKDFIDTNIVENYVHEEAMKCIHVGLLCTEESPSLRPTMSDVYSMLSNPTTTMPQPTKPAFVNIKDEKMRHNF